MIRSCDFDVRSLLRIDYKNIFTLALSYALEELKLQLNSAEYCFCLRFINNLTGNTRHPTNLDSHICYLLQKIVPDLQDIVFPVRGVST